MELLAVTGNYHNWSISGQSAVPSDLPVFFSSQNLTDVVSFSPMRKWGRERKHYFVTFTVYVTFYNIHWDQANWGVAAENVKKVFLRPCTIIVSHHCSYPWKQLLPRAVSIRCWWIFDIDQEASKSAISNWALASPCRAHPFVGLFTNDHSWTRLLLEYKLRWSLSISWQLCTKF